MLSIRLFNVSTSLTGFSVIMQIAGSRSPAGSAASGPPLYLPRPSESAGGGDTAARHGRAPWPARRYQSADCGPARRPGKLAPRLQLQRGQNGAAGESFDEVPGQQDGHLFDWERPRGRAATHKGRPTGSQEELCHRTAVQLSQDRPKIVSIC